MFYPLASSSHFSFAPFERNRDNGFPWRAFESEVEEDEEEDEDEDEDEGEEEQDDDDDE